MPRFLKKGGFVGDVFNIPLIFIWDRKKALELTNRAKASALGYPIAYIYRAPENQRFLGKRRNSVMIQS